MFHTDRRTLPRTRKQVTKSLTHNEIYRVDRSRCRFRCVHYYGHLRGVCDLFFQARETDCTAGGGSGCGGGSSFDPFPPLPPPPPPPPAVKKSVIGARTQPRR